MQIQNEKPPSYLAPHGLAMHFLEWKTLSRLRGLKKARALTLQIAAMTDKKVINL